MLSPRTIVVCPTSTPATSVIASSGPVGRIPTFNPRSAARGRALEVVFWAAANAVSNKSVAVAKTLLGMGIEYDQIPVRWLRPNQNSTSPTYCCFRLPHDFRIVGNSSLTTVMEEWPVTRPRSAAAQQNSHFRMERQVRMLLCVRRDRDGQGEPKSCAPPGGTGRPQAAAMRLDDRATDGQPHTGPVILGSKECPEDLVRLLRGQSHTGIADRDQQLTIAGFRLDGKLTSATRFLHGIDAIKHEVHENLLQLDTVYHDLGKIVSKFGADGNRVAVRLAAQQDNHFSNDFIYINQLPLQSALLEQRADSANDISRARYVFNESRCSFACLCHIGLIATKPSQAGFSVCYCCGNRLLDFVR